ncbi:hypothetical protein EDC01DRAFT_654050 [Geopyxis carbonaria]|nr:hypothetical protein EDC01DRAFT_654050 [Geopyxis carbonaria]
MKLKLDYLELGQKEIKTEIKDLGNKMDREFDHVDGKFDKTDCKIHRVLYGIVTGLIGFVLKGGLDHVLREPQEVGCYSIGERSGVAC